MQNDKWEQFLTKFFWSCSLGLVAYGVNTLHSVEKSVNRLNQQMGVAIEKLTTGEKINEHQDFQISELDARIRVIEIFIKGGQYEFRNRKKP